MDCANLYDLVQDEVIPEDALTQMAEDEVKKLEESRSKYRSLAVIAPTCVIEGENEEQTMRPDFWLSNPECCPLAAEKKGHCSECVKNMGIYSENGTIFAYGVYEVFCDTKEKS